MSKKHMPNEKNVEQLLKKLSTEKRPYPKDLLDARRTAYLSQVISVVSSGPHIKKGNGQGQSGSAPTSAPMTPLMRIVLVTLVAANVALAAYLAVSFYENWDKVQELLLEVSSANETPLISTETLDQLPELETTPEIAIPPAETVAPISTPEPASPSDGSRPSESPAADSPQFGPSEPEASTPEPDEKDNSGKHLGQTPHGPGDPPGQDNQDNSQDNAQDNDQGNQDNDKDQKNNNDKNKKDKDNNP